MNDTTAQAETQLLEILHTITACWPAMLTPPAGGPTGAHTTRITADDHDPTEADIPWLDRIVSLRYHTTTSLNGWCRVIATDRPVKTALPDGADTPDMCAFLTRHAQWFSGHEAAQDCIDELDDFARRIRNVVTPHRKEWHYLGDCPFVVEDWFCAGRIRVRIGGDESQAACSDCGQEASVEWWEDVLDVPRQEPVRPAGMARILADRLKVTVTERTVRNWARDGRITPLVPFGPQPEQPRYWFDPRQVLDEVARMDRECPRCGRIWSGHGDVCSRCWRTMQTARPGRAGKRPRASTPMRLDGFCPWPRFRVVADRRDDDRPDRCHYSDLPMDQCACGRDHDAAV